MTRCGKTFPLVAALMCAGLLSAGSVARGDEGYKYERGGVLFYAGFDGKRDADFSVGDGKATLRDGGGQLTASGFDSVRGGALLSGDGIGWVEFLAENNVLPDEGTIEMWVRPDNWDNDDGKYHGFLDIQGERGGGIRFYKVTTGYNVFAVKAPEAQQPPLDLSKPSMREHPGIVEHVYDCQQVRTRWVLYFFMWKKSEFIDKKRGYLDFQFVHPLSPLRASAPTPSPGRLSAIHIGDINSDKSRTLFDEVYIYNRALTYEECCWAAANTLTRKPGMDIPVNFAQPKANVVPDPAKSTLVVEIDSGDRSGNFAGTARLEPAAGTSPAPIVRKEGRFGEAVIPYSDLPEGKYKVICDLTTAGGESLASISAPLVVPGPPVWLTEKVGVSDTPPPPWTPVEVEEDIVRVWGRDYRLGAFGLPAEVRTQGVSTLAGPVTFRAAAGGSEVSWEEEKRGVVSRTPAVVVWEGTSRSALGELSWRTQAEFDGFLLHDFSLTPAGEAAVELMELRIPIRKEYAYLWYKGSNERGFPPKGTGAIYKANFGRYWWLGTDDFGLCGATEHAGANLDDAKDAFNIVREENGDVTVAYRFAGKPTVLKEPWSLRLILQATPTKPLPGDWRTWRDVLRCDFTSHPSTRDNATVKLAPATPWPLEASHVHFSFPVPRDANSYRNYVKNLHEKGVKVLPYCQFNTFSPGMAESDFYWKEWFNPLAGPTELSGWQQMAAARPVPSYIDFMVWKHRELIREYGHDGFYVDFAGATGTALAPEHGLGYERDGVQHPADFPIVAWREVWKRMYTMLHEEKKAPVIFGHTSANAYAPMLSFCDIWLPGEHNWTVALRDNYLEVLPLDELRAEFRAQAHGGIPWWLPQLKQAILEDKDVATRDSAGNINFVTLEKSHHMLGIGLLLDIGFWQTDGMNPEAIMEYWRAQDKFGIADAKFSGYWNNSDLVGGQTEEVKASVYRKPEGGALIVVYNTTREAKTVNLTVAWDKLKSAGPLSVIDAYTEKPIDWRVKSVTIEVPPLNYRLIWVR